MNLSNINNFQTDLFDPLIGPKQVLAYPVREDLWKMSIKTYSTLPRPPELERQH